MTSFSPFTRRRVERGLQALALTGVLLLVLCPALTPLGGPPYFRFERDWRAFAALMLFVLPSLALQLSQGVSARLNAWALLGLGLGLVLLVQCGTGRAGFFAPIAAIQMGYLLALALTAVAADGWVRSGRAAVLAQTLACGLVLAAAFNALAMVAQFFEQEAWFLGTVERVIATGRMDGLIGQSNLAASILMLGLWSLHEAEDSGHWAGPRIGLLRGLALLLLLALVMSGSRTGMLQLLAVTLWLLLEQRRQAPSWFWRCLPLWYALLLGALWAYARLSDHPFAAGLSRLSAQTDTRWPAWQMAWEMGWQSPWIGVGFREFGWAQLTVPLDTVSRLKLDHAHNLFLNIWAEMGLAGLLALGIPLVWWLWRERPWRGADPSSRFGMGVLLILGLHALTEFPLWWAFLLFAFVMAGSLLPARGLPLARALPWLPALAITAALWPLAQDMARVEAVYRFSVADGPAVREEGWARARESRWLASAVQRQALLQRAPDPAAPAQEAALAGRLLHVSADAGVAAWRVRALFLAGQLDEARQLNDRLLLLYPRLWCTALRDNRPAAAAALEPSLRPWLQAGAGGENCAR